MTINILIILVLAMVILVFKFSYLLYPVVPLKPGEKVVVFMDRSYNRTATISKNIVDGVVIYDKMLLPVNYRGTFYAVGYTDDRHKLIYVTHRRYIYLALYAELERKLFGCKGYDDPTIEKDIDETDEDTDDDTK